VQIHIKSESGEFPAARSAEYHAKAKHFQFLLLSNRFLHPVKTLIFKLVVTIDCHENIKDASLVSTFQNRWAATKC
jgi:hypothetical protein